MTEHEQWYSVDAESARFFQLGELLEKGAQLGYSTVSSKPVIAEETGRIVGIQYDIALQELIVVLDSASQRHPRVAERPSRRGQVDGQRRTVVSRRTQQKEVVGLGGGNIR